jgi:glucokinase
MYAIGVDVGGKSVRAGGVNREGELILFVKKPVRRGSVIEDIVLTVDEIKDRLGESPCVGVGIPGPLNLREGTVPKAPHFPEWRNFPIRYHLKNRMKLLAMDNDANMAALGEMWRGAAKGVKNFCMLTLGTGVGGGVVVDGNILHGALGSGGELGHIVVDPDGPPCACGARGCLESFCSASAIEKKLKMSPKDLAELAEKGDRDAVSFWKDFGRYLGIGIATLLNIFNPELIIIGGGISAVFPLFIEDAKREAERAFPINRCKIERAELYDRAGVIGAAYAAFTVLS